MLAVRRVRGACASSERARGRRQMERCMRCNRRSRICRRRWCQRLFRGPGARPLPRRFLSRWGRQGLSLPWYGHLGRSLARVSHRESRSGPTVRWYCRQSASLPSAKRTPRGLPCRPHRQCRNSRPRRRRESPRWIRACHQQSRRKRGSGLCLLRASALRARGFHRLPASRCHRSVCRRRPSSVSSRSSFRPVSRCNAGVFGSALALLVCPNRSRARAPRISAASALAVVAAVDSRIRDRAVVA